MDLNVVKRNAMLTPLDALDEKRLLQTLHERNQR